MHDPLAFCRVHFRDSLQQGQRIVALERCLLRVCFLFRFNFDVRKKLLRLSTALSSRSEVTPIDLGHIRLLGEK